jgi:hypothetical protein
MVLEHAWAGFIVLYGVLSFACAVIPLAAQRRMLGLLWMLGPPANLIYGTRYVKPFLVGTVVTAVLFSGVVHSRGPVPRIYFLMALLVAWIVFGFIAYAPGA